ncbi:TBC1 domain family member 13-like isoform X1 [Zingiber officinale]|uniref:TBC1 domain family member 13-like isoform X1 n=1 Tax=Zingiber officinale TaxID=94328 RepID=UPI001C4CC717|nr:TBC1 domain family member 13-like isoform X1 [Zingiber officinale]
MGKKGVPEWLNSSIWSSSTSSSAATVAAASHPADRSPRSLPPPKPEPPVQAVIPEPPPSPRPAPPPPPPPREAPRPSSGTLSGDPNPSRLSEEDVSRQSQLLSELSKKVINIEELRRLASQGIPDGAGIRSTIWKLLLGYLPRNRELWGQELDRKRVQYNDFREEFLVNPSEVARRMEESCCQKNEELGSGGHGFLTRSGITHDEHPLSLGKTSVWNQFFKDAEIIEQIDRDVKRTHPDMQFFNGDSSFAVSNQEVMRRILIIFAKLNPGIRYVQGMNEILAPLFYVFKNDPEANNAEYAEADAFFCFVELLSAFRDNFCQKLDNSVVGIRSTISKLSELLKKHDEELWRHLEVTTKVNPQFYAFRWITLLLTQEFNFADSLHIWDTLLSDPEGPQETLLRICCAMLILVRRRLLAGDFTSNLKLLQNYPSTNISHLLYVANKLRGSSAG